MRQPDQAWTNAEFRVSVIQFLDAYVEARDWAESWVVEETFGMDRKGDIREKVRRTGTLLLESPDGFLRRNATPHLAIVVNRCEKAVGPFSVETGVAFEEGVELLAQTFVNKLNSVGTTLDALRRQ
jgi:hypothetical protein